MDPKVSGRIFEDVVDGIVWDRIRPFKEMLEAESVIAVQSHVGADPKETARVLEYHVYAVVGQAVAHGKTPELSSIHGWAEQQEQYGDQ